jgi:hypothetical protein
MSQYQVTSHLSPCGTTCVLILTSNMRQRKRYHRSDVAVREHRRDVGMPLYTPVVSYDEGQLRRSRELSRPTILNRVAKSRVDLGTHGTVYHVSTLFRKRLCKARDGW